MAPAEIPALTTAPLTPRIHPRAGRGARGRAWRCTVSRPAQLLSLMLLLLGACGGTPKKPLDVNAGLWDPNPAVRTDALNAARQTRDLQQVPRLIELLDDSDGGVRMSAAAALEDLTGRQTDYRPWADVEARRAAVLDWRAWWASRTRTVTPAPGRAP